MAAVVSTADRQIPLPLPQEAFAQRLSRAEFDFLNFHRLNPEVYRILVRLARQAKEKGYRRIGVKMLWEVMRWEISMSTQDPADGVYKLNNNYHSRFARLIMASEPDLKEFFATRKLKT